MRFLGEIASFRNLVFKRTGVDHASITGRPCIVLSEINDKLFLLPLSSHFPLSADINKYRYGIETKDIEIYEDYVLRSPIQVVNMDEILEKSVCGYEVIGEIKRKVYLNLLLKLKQLKLQELSYAKENYELVKEDIEEQIKYLVKKKY